MARNPVQFQKGISRTSSRSTAPKTNAIDALYQWRWNPLPTSNSAIAATARPRSPHNHRSGHLPHDPGQERGLGDEAAPHRAACIRHKLIDGARPRAPAQLQLDDAYLGGESGGKRGLRPARRPLSPPWLLHEAHRRRLGAPRYRHAPAFMASLRPAAFMSRWWSEFRSATSRLARHLPCDSSQVCSAISLGRVSFQSSLRLA